MEYLKVVGAPGLSYSSTEWGDYDATANPPHILPSVFVKYELPEHYSELNVSLKEGPEWCYQGYNIETLEDGKTYLLSVGQARAYKQRKPKAHTMLIF